jgi:hypothetical protein
MSDRQSTTAKKPQNSDSTFKVSQFQSRGFGVQAKSEESTPASKSELWESYQQAKQLNQKGVNSSPSPIQAKLTIGAPGDKYEQDADSMAAQVIQMPESESANSNIANSVQTRSIQPIQRVCAECQEETKEESKPAEEGDQIQAKEEMGQTSELTSVWRKVNSAEDLESNSNLCKENNIIQRDFFSDLNSQSPRSKQPVLWGGIDPKDPNIRWLGDNTPKTSEELDIGFTPDSRDPFEKPPSNWDELAMPALGSDKPEAWAGVTKVPLAPLPKLKLSGEPSLRITEEQQNAANSALNTFETDYAVVNSSWISIIPLIEEFMNANKQVEGKGILGSEGGLGWNQGDKNADISKLTGQQKIGPHDEMTVDSLFNNNKDGTTGLNTHFHTSGLKGNKKTKTLLNKAKIAANEVKNADAEHKIAQLAIKGTAAGLKAAILQVTIIEDQVEIDKVQDTKDKLVKDKEIAVEKLENIFATIETMTLIGFGVVDGITDGPVHGAESIAIGVEIGLEAWMKHGISLDYDPKIEECDQKIRMAISIIRSRQKEYSQVHLISAETAHSVAMNRIHTTRDELINKIAAHQSAYSDFAEAAGVSVGGGSKGLQVHSMIEAIPKVEYCLARIASISSAIKLPIYIAQSGRGFNGFGQPIDFIIHLSQLKGYKDKFNSLKYQWESRLKNMKAIEQKFQ